MSLTPCSATVPGKVGWASYHCSKWAVKTENGKPYCTIHAPSYRSARNEAKRAKRDARSAALTKQRQERERRAECYPYLLSALRRAAPYIKTVSRNDKLGYDDNTLYEDMLAAIAKASSPQAY